jgi:methyl-accepting chemotaxis protein/ABC-type transport system substrate-binding protein
LRNRGWLKLAGAIVVAVAVLAILGAVILPEGAFTLRFWLFLAAAGVLAGGVSVFFARETGGRVRESLDALLRSLAAGNLNVGTGTEVQRVMEEYPGFQRVLRSFQNMIGYLQDGSDSVSSASSAISSKTRVLFKEVQDEVESVSRVRESVRALEREIEQVVGNVDGLSSVSEQTGSAVLEMRASIDEVVGSTHNLSSFVDEIGVSIEEMARSVEEVAEHTESLSSFAIENSSAMVEMDATIGQIEENIRETEGISKQVAEVSATGTRVVKETVRGLEKIHAAMTGTLSAMEGLRERSREIGKILKVIREIADQTNLLALNAAIIAAQAGEHGKSFGVVAEEIRDLSERTAASTAEVGAITGTIQKDVEAASDVAREVMERVEEGLQLGRSSEENLVRIGQAIDMAGNNISHISRAASEQAKGSRQVTAAIEEMTKRIERISSATREQAKTSQLINQKASVMKDLTRNVDRAMEEQAMGSNAIAQGMDQVRGSVEGIQRALIKMSQAGQRIVQAMDTISGASQQNLAGARDLAATSSILRQESLVLSEQMGSFSLPKPVRGGEVRLGYVTYDFNLDPAFANNLRDGELCHVFNEGLLKFGYGTRLLPGLAEEWTTGVDGTVYTFRLRPNATFHNGRKVTSQDVLFSWHRAASPKLETGGQWFLSWVEGAEEYIAGKAPSIRGLKALDERTVEVKLREPLAFFPYMLSTPEACMVPKEAVDERTYRMARHVGAGPYQVVDVARDRVVFERHRGYYDDSIPYSDRLVFDYSAQGEDELVRNLKEGRAHVVPSFSNEAIESLLADPFWENNTEYTVLLNTTVVSIRNDLSPGSIKEVRQALNYAVDRQALLAQYPHSRITPAAGLLPPGIIGYRSDRKGYYHDPEKARWLLSRAGFPGGIDLHIPLDASRIRQHREFMLLVEMFRKAGVRIETETVSHEEFESRRRRGGGRPLLYSTGWYADYPDPDSFLYVLFHSKAGDPLEMRFKSPELEALVERGRRSLDVEERIQIYQEAEDIVVDEAPCVLLYHSWGVVPHRPELMGMKLSLTPPVIRPEFLWLGGS